MYPAESSVNVDGFEQINQFWLGFAMVVYGKNKFWYNWLKNNTAQLEFFHFTDGCLYYLQASISAHGEDPLNVG